MIVMLSRRPNTTSMNNSVVAIGNFDGCHIGHQAILKTVKNLAIENHLQSCLLTFEPYPQTILYPEKKIARLTSLREKIAVLNKLAIEKIVALPFDKKLANLSAQQFIDDILVKALRAQIVIVGEDFRFGKQRQGDIHLLQTCQSLKTVIMPAITLDNQRVSSTAVREALANGNLILAKSLLDRSFTMQGKVVHGNQRGRQLGFPTANIALRKRVPPLLGVFAVYAYLDNQKIAGVANIGKRPTVDGERSFLEIYLFNFDQDIYGKQLTVEFVEKLRPEMRFASITDLQRQIQQDVTAAKMVLAANDQK